MKVQFKQWACIAQGAHYAGGGKAIKLIDEEDGEPVATATVNIPGIDLDHDVVFVKDFSENIGIVQALLMGGVIGNEIIETVNNQFVTINAYRLTNEALNNLW